MCACMPMCVWLYDGHRYICAYVYVCLYVLIYVCIYMRVYALKYMYVWLYVGICMCTRRPMCAGMLACAYGCCTGTVPGVVYE